MTDLEWLDLLQHIWHGKLNEMHITILRQLVLTHEGCPPTDFASPPWRDTLLGYTETCGADEVEFDEHEGPYPHTSNSDFANQLSSL